MLCRGVIAKPKGRADQRPTQEIGSQTSDPTKDREASIGLEHKQGDSLLEEQANYDSRPLTTRRV
jgi:hypothetical protein